MAQTCFVLGLTDNTGTEVQGKITPGASGTVLTSTGTSTAPTFQAAGGGGITTINGGSGSITGSTVTLSTGFQQGTINFRGITATQMTLDSSDGANNTAFGSASLVTLAAGGGSGGSNNTAFGSQSCAGISAGSDNVGIGYLALNNIEGFGGPANATIAIGSSAGQNYFFGESNNICINSLGVTSENNTLHIGSGTGTGAKQLNAAFISGITGITVTGTAVLVSSANQLGVAVSSKIYKENIESVESFESSKIYDLNPVTFHYKNDETKILHYGLIAEDVEPVLPELVLYDLEGKLLTVEYHELPILLLKEIQILRKELNELKIKLV